MNKTNTSDLAELSDWLFWHCLGEDYPYIAETVAEAVRELIESIEDEIFRRANEARNY